MMLHFYPVALLFLGKWIREKGQFQGSLSGTNDTTLVKINILLSFLPSLPSVHLPMEKVRPREGRPFA